MPDRQDSFNGLPYADVMDQSLNSDTKTKKRKALKGKRKIKKSGKAKSSLSKSRLSGSLQVITEENEQAVEAVQRVNRKQSGFAQEESKHFVTPSKNQNLSYLNA